MLLLLLVIIIFRKQRRKKQHRLAGEDFPWSRLSLCGRSCAQFHSEEQQVEEAAVEGNKTQNKYAVVSACTSLVCVQVNSNRSKNVIEGENVQKLAAGCQSSVCVCV